MKQAEGAREVLIVTGRGNHSYRAACPSCAKPFRRLLAYLSTRGSWKTTASIRRGRSPFALHQCALAARVATDTPVNCRRRSLDPPTLEGLSATTREQLRVLAIGHAARHWAIRDAIAAVRARRDAFASACSSRHRFRTPRPRTRARRCFRRPLRARSSDSTTISGESARRA